MCRTYSKDFQDSNAFNNIRRLLHYFFTPRMYVQYVDSGARESYFKDFDWSKHKDLAPSVWMSVDFEIDVQYRTVPVPVPVPAVGLFGGASKNLRGCNYN